MNENRIIAFGDIHGCYKATKTAIILAKQENAIAVFLGDYVDRGPDSIKTLKVLLEAKKKNPDWIFLRGNHDQMLLDLIIGKAEPNSEGVVLDTYGFSYERSTKTYYNLKKESKEFQDNVKEFLEELLYFHETEDYIFVHAPLNDSSIPLDKKSKEMLIWNYNLNPIWEGKKFIHGHAPVKKPITTNKGTNINTECGNPGGHLTGLLISIFFLRKMKNLPQNERN